MRRFAQVAVLAAMLAFAGTTASRAAVATGNIRVTGSGPYTISYITADEAVSGTIAIKNSAGTTVRSIPIPSTELFSGAHTLTDIWNGRDAGGTAVPVGNYYAEITTTGGSHFSMAQLWGPTQTADATGSPIDGRNDYGGDINNNPNSPYKNLYYFATRASNTSARTGVWVANPDTTHNTFFNPTGVEVGTDWVSAAILSDDNILLTGRSSGNVIVARPDNGTVVATYGAGRVKTRTVVAFGDAAHPELFFADEGSSGGGGAGSIDYIADVSTYTATSTPLVLVPVGSLPSSARVVVVNKAKTSLWASGALGTTGTAGPAYAWIRKFNLTRDASNNITGATPDANFVYHDPYTFNPPVTYPTASNQRGLALSPDESVLWFSINEGIADFAIGNSLIIGYNANTGAVQSDSHIYVASFNTEELSVQKSGNIIVSTYPGQITGSTAREIYLIAPADTSSTDTTRSPTFVVTGGNTTIQITVGPTVQKTFHGGTITWTTNFPSSTVVNYGTTSGVLDKTLTGTDGVTNHTATINDIDQNTTVYYEVVSAAEGFTTATSAQQSFTTNTLTLSNVQVASTSDTTATITWTSSEPATSVVRYGTVAGNPDLTRTDNALTATHSVTLTNLTPATTYYFKVESGFTDPLLLTTVSAEQNFTTKTTLRVLSESVSVTKTSAAITFVANAPMQATIRYGTAPDALTGTATSTGGSDTQTVTLSGLTAGTTYYYTAEFGGPTVSTLNSPVSTLTTALAVSTPGTFTHATAADLGKSWRANLNVGGSGGLIALQKQSVPGVPVAMPDLPEPRYYMATVAHNGYLYVLGGRNTSGADTDTAYYAPIQANGTLGAWGTTTALPTVRAFNSSMVAGYNGYIYLVNGGGAGGTTQNTVFYAKQNADGTLGAWQQTSSTPSERDIATVTVADGYLMLLGGEDNNGNQYATVFTSQIRADGSIGPWLSAPNMEHPKWFLRSASNNHTVYSIGGFQSQVDFWDYIAISRTMPDGLLTPWVRFTTEADEMDVPHYGMAAGLIGGKILTVGGRAGGDTPHTGVSYTRLNPDDTTVYPWVTHAPENDPNGLAIAVLDNDGTPYENAFYAVGGRQTFGQANGVPAVTMFPMTQTSPNLTTDAADVTGYVFNGTLEAPVMDLGAMANLEHLSVNGTGLSATTLEVRYRFAAANAIFSDWFTLNGSSADISGGARYFQYQIILKGNGSTTPVVSGITLTTSGVVEAPAAKALRIAGGLLEATAADKTALDKDGDGAITLKDVVMLARP